MRDVLPVQTTYAALLAPISSRLQQFHRTNSLDYAEAKKRLLTRHGDVLKAKRETPADIKAKKIVAK